MPDFLDRHVPSKVVISISIYSPPPPYNCSNFVLCYGRDFSGLYKGRNPLKLYHLDKIVRFISYKNIIMAESRFANISQRFIYLMI